MNSYSILIISLLTIISEVRGTPPQNFYDCINANMKWDFQINQCLKGRTWTEIPKTLVSKIDRDFENEEIDMAIHSMKISSDKTLSYDQKPEGIIIIGTPSSGKTSICSKLHHWFPDFKLDHFVSFDGDLIRDAHKGYISSVSNPNIGYHDAWPVLKPYIAPLKEKLLEIVLTEKRNVIFPTGVYAHKFYKILKEQGYNIKLVGIYVDYEESKYRGLNRAQWTGRTFLSSEKKWKKGIQDMEDLFHKEDINQAIIIDNSNLLNPKILSSRF